MDASDVQVWIETRREGGQLIVVPFAQSVSERKLDFRLNARCGSAGGNSSVSQQGQLTLNGGQSVQLARLSLGATGKSRCELEIALRSGGKDAGVYRYDLSDR